MFSTQINFQTMLICAARLVTGGPNQVRTSHNEFALAAVEVTDFGNYSN